MERLTRLKEILFVTDSSESLRQLPEQLAAVLEGYEDSNVHPSFKTEIFHLITGITTLSRTLLDPSIMAKPAIFEALSLIQALSRVVSYLEERPAQLGYALLLPNSNDLHSDYYSTRDEADRALLSLQSLGAGAGCTVVPASLVAGHVPRPATPPKPETKSVDDITAEIRREMEEARANDLLAIDHQPIPAQFTEPR